MFSFYEYVQFFLSIILFQNYLRSQMVEGQHNLWCMARRGGGWDPPLPELVGLSSKKKSPYVISLSKSRKELFHSI
jgi:hypothetical protein